MRKRTSALASRLNKFRFDDDFSRTIIQTLREISSSKYLDRGEK